MSQDGFNISVLDVWNREMLRHVIHVISIHLVVQNVCIKYYMEIVIFVVSLLNGYSQSTEHTAHDSECNIELNVYTWIHIDKWKLNQVDGMHTHLMCKVDSNGNNCITVYTCSLMAYCMCENAKKDPNWKIVAISFYLWSNMMAQIALYSYSQFVTMSMVLL